MLLCLELDMPDICKAENLAVFEGHEKAKSILAETLFLWGMAILFMRINSHVNG